MRIVCQPAEIANNRSVVIFISLACTRTWHGLASLPVCSLSSERVRVHYFLGVACNIRLYALSCFSFSDPSRHSLNDTAQRFLVARESRFGRFSLHHFCRFTCIIKLSISNTQHLARILHFYRNVNELCRSFFFFYDAMNSPKVSLKFLRFSRFTVVLGLNFNKKYSRC